MAQPRSRYDNKSADQKQLTLGSSHVSILKNLTDDKAKNAAIKIQKNYRRYKMHIEYRISKIYFQRLISSLPQVSFQDEKEKEAKKILDTIAEHGYCLRSSELPLFWMGSHVVPITALKDKPILVHGTYSNALPGILFRKCLLPAETIKKDKVLKRVTGESGASAYTPMEVSFWHYPKGVSYVNIHARYSADPYAIPISFVICENDTSDLKGEEGTEHGELTFNKMPLSRISYMTVPSRFVASFQKYFDSLNLKKPKVISYGELSYTPRFLAAPAVAPTTVVEEPRVRPNRCAAITGCHVM